jgi:hypothetical protein
MSHVRLETWDCEDPTFKLYLKEHNIEMLVQKNPSPAREDACFLGTREALTEMITEQWQDADLLDEIQDGDPNRNWDVMVNCLNGDTGTILIAAPTRGIALDRAANMNLDAFNASRSSLVVILPFFVTTNERSERFATKDAAASFIELHCLDRSRQNNLEKLIETNAR